MCVVKEIQGKDYVMQKPETTALQSVCSSTSPKAKALQM